MIIKGKLGEYNVCWERSGWSYAVPIVYVRKKFSIFSYWSKAWEGKCKTAKTASQLTPKPMVEWFNEAVYDYEKYVAEWEKHEAGI